MKEFRLSASRARVHLGEGPTFWAWTYNGRVPGPEIRVREGEIIRVVLRNYLPEEASIHWHGVPVPNRMDGVPGVTQNGVRPGESFLYEFEARPAGTYIYHSHAGYQLDQGLYGAFIIEPAKESGSHDREYTLLLEDWVMKDGGGRARTRRRSPMGMMGGMMRGRSEQAGAPLLEPFYDGYSVNGRLYPHLEPLEVKQGEKVKLRLLNPSSATIYDLQLAGHPMTVTHTDGRPVAPMQTDILRIGMGERYDVEFVADNPGAWLLSARETGLGEGQLRIPVQYKGTRAHTPTPPDFLPGRSVATCWDMQAPYPDPSSSPATPGRFIPQTLSGGMHSPYWSINGEIYPGVAPIRVSRGEQVRLGYWNHSMMPHPMHLHGHFFKVVNPAVPRDLWIQKDTVIVDPMQRVEIEFIADNPGPWFHHCHNLYHMNAGMANVVTVQA
ncbi:MAG: multicopper oxidase family protein [Deltaproteobacteria bacterium]|nr:multicopper oxidase family protein [Deltaproteobacteria bacterium]